LIVVSEIHNSKEHKIAQKIRYSVFTIGQKVPVEDDIDKFENSSIHYLAYLNNTPVGTARWRITESGFKLERFAVLDEFRFRGVGSVLVRKVLQDIRIDPDAENKKIYLNAQVDAIGLYKKFGFIKQGDMFEESGLLHYTMVKV